MWQEECSHSTFRDEFQAAPVVSMGHEHEPAPQQYGFGLVEDHRLTLKIYQQFRCNSAEYRTSRQLAELKLINLLYEDVLRNALDVKSAIFSGDKREATRCIDKILDICKGEV